MRSATCVIGGALLVLAARPAPAPADDTAPAGYRAVIDRVDLEPASIGGLRLRVELSALAIGGQLLDLSDPKSIKLMVGGSKLDAPYSLGAYGGTGADTAVVVVLQANLVYAETLPSILSTLDDIVLSALPDRTQVAIITYGDATGTGKLGSLKAARGRLAQISQDGSASEPALLDTLDRALLLLKKARTTPEGRPLRKLAVVIGDGRDRSGDRERVTQLGQRADKQGVRILTLGYAPSNVRRPLLTLGELSKRSLGTFRWVRSGGAESWSPAFQQLRDEIVKQYVLTYFLPADADIAGKKLKIVTVGRTEATSNELRIPEPACGRDPCAGYCVDAVCVTGHEAQSRGVLGWIVLVLG
ncbi:MAG TPA: vWA domain-containing protein, partial [Kofleriaceae bacterium]